MRRLFLAVLIALTAGCVTLGPATPADRPARASVEAFALEGRIVVSRAGERFSAGIEWRHDRQTDEIVLSGPLGQGLARLTAGGGAALLETAERKQYAAADMESLSEQVFGSRLPITGLGRWVLGRAAFGGTASADAAGRLSSLAEQGWAIEYLRYEDESPEALQALLRARRGDIEVRLVIDRWTVSP